MSVVNHLVSRLEKDDFSPLTEEERAELLTLASSEDEEETTFYVNDALREFVADHLSPGVVKHDDIKMLLQDLVKWHPRIVCFAVFMEDLFGSQKVTADESTIVKMKMKMKNTVDTPEVFHESEIQHHFARALTDLVFTPAFCAIVSSQIVSRIAAAASMPADSHSAEASKLLQTARSCILAFGDLAARFGDTFSSVIDTVETSIAELARNETPARKRALLSAAILCLPDSSVLKVRETSKEVQSESHEPLEHGQERHTESEPASATAEAKSPEPEQHLTTEEEEEEQEERIHLAARRLSDAASQAESASDWCMLL
ncbi:MAG: hypothetical protein MHM6MM_005309 [Cercozoa sp. M6MM]